MKKYRIAIIGATGTARKRMLPSLQKSELCEVAAVQARNPARLELVSREFGGIPVFADIEDMLGKVKYDLVYIATPPFLHLENIRSCLKYNLPIICEKPLCSTCEEASQIESLVSAAKVPFMLGHHLRHQPALAEIKQIISSGELGPVLSVWGQWGFNLNKSATNAVWKLSPELGGAGVIADTGIHIIDLLIYLFGQPKYVTAHGFKCDSPHTIDNATALLSYDSMSVALNCSQTMTSAGNHVLVYGAQGSLESCGALGESSIRKITVNSKLSNRVLNFDPVDLYRREVEDFIGYYFENEKVPRGTTLQEAISGIQVIQAIATSYREGRAVEI
jgi:predicted dehydrogenase